MSANSISLPVAEHPSSVTERNIKTLQNIGQIICNEKLYWEEKGGGGYGTIFKALGYNEEYYALKRFVPGTKGNEGFLKEWNAYLAIGEHDNILRFFGAYKDLSGNLYLALEFCSKTCLRTVVHTDNTYTERQVQLLVQQLVAALGHIHSKGFVHRDVKLENVLVKIWEPDNIHVAIGDFNFAKKMNVAKTSLGTFNYFAPEVYGYYKDDIEFEENLAPRANYNDKCDVWSLGVLTYLLLSGGRFPYFLTPEQEEACREAETENERKNMKHQFMKNLVQSNSAPRFPRDQGWGPISEPAKEFLVKALKMHPKERPRCEDIKDDVWFHSSFDKPAVIEYLEYNHDVTCQLDTTD